MKFCEICNNMLFSKINSEDSSLKYYCKSCGNQVEQDIHDNCVYSSNYNNQDISFRLKINDFTHLDPTLPRVNNIPCPNSKCLSNSKNGKKPEIIYIKYDITNMKFIYVCTLCKQSWKT